MSNIHPAEAEERVLKLGYNRFLDLYEEIISEQFWSEEPSMRLTKIKDICSVYTEMLKYPPLKHILANATHPHYMLVGKDFVTFLRNLLLHFPYFKTWSEIRFDKTLITTFETTGSIDKFLSKTHPEDIKYRFWDSKAKKMTYVEVHLNTKYANNECVQLNDIISEKSGVRFLCIFMKGILMTQIESISDASLTIT